MTFRIIRPVAIADINLISSNIVENDYPTFSLGSTYALGDRVIVVATNVHSVYQSVVAGNNGHDPLLDSLSTPLYWSRVGSTKRWTMFDQSITSQSTNPSSISVTLNVPSRVDSVSLMIERLHIYVIKPIMMFWNRLVDAMIVSLMRCMMNDKHHHHPMS